MNINKYLILSISFILYGCMSYKVESTMDDYKEIASSGYGAGLSYMVESQCCVKSFPDDIKSMSLNTRLTKGGFRYAPYSFLGKNQNLDYKSIELIKRTPCQ